MKKNYNILFAILFYILAIYILYNYFTNSLNITPISKIYRLTICCLSIYIGSSFISKIIKVKHKKALFKINIIIFLILYVMLLIDTTIFDNYLHRNLNNIFTIDKIWRDKYFNESINFIPFHTIYNYFSNFFKNNITGSVFLNNIVGNLMLLAPLGILIPLIFSGSTKKHMLIIFIISLLIELLQLITMSGYVDIDDIILNVFGAYICYKIFHLKPIKIFIEKNIYF